MGNTYKLRQPAERETSFFFEVGGTFLVLTWKTFGVFICYARIVFACCLSPWSYVLRWQYHTAKMHIYHPPPLLILQDNAQIKQNFSFKMQILCVISPHKKSILNKSSKKKLCMHNKIILKVCFIVENAKKT